MASVSICAHFQWAVRRHYTQTKNLNFLFHALTVVLVPAESWQAKPMSCWYCGPPVRKAKGHRLPRRHSSSACSLQRLCGAVQHAAHQLASRWVKQRGDGHFTADCSYAYCEHCSCGCKSELITSPPWPSLLSYSLPSSNTSNIYYCISSY